MKVDLQSPMFVWLTNVMDIYVGLMLDAFSLLVLVQQEAMNEHQPWGLYFVTIFKMLQSQTF